MDFDEWLRIKGHGSWVKKCVVQRDGHVSGTDEAIPFLLQPVLMTRGLPRLLREPRNDRISHRSLTAKIILDKRKTLCYNSAVIH